MLVRTIAQAKIADGDSYSTDPDPVLVSDNRLKSNSVASSILYASYAKVSFFSSLIATGEVTK